MKKLILIIVLFLSFYFSSTAGASLQSYAVRRVSDSALLDMSTGTGVYYVGSAGRINQTVFYVVDYTAVSWINTKIVGITGIPQVSFIMWNTFRPTSSANNLVSVTNTVPPCTIYTSSYINDGSEYRYCTGGFLSTSYTTAPLINYTNLFYCSGDNETKNITNNVVTCGYNSTTAVINLYDPVAFDGLITGIYNNPNWNTFIVRTVLYFGLGISIFIILIFILFSPFLFAKNTILKIKNKLGKK